MKGIENPKEVSITSGLKLMHFSFRSLKNFPKQPKRSENGLGKLTQKEIINFAYNGYKRFYLRPKYIFGQIYRSMLRNDYSLLFNGMRYLSMLKGITNT